MRSQDCAVHVHTTLVPVESHHIWPIGYHGPNVMSNRVQVCANAHSDIHYLLERMLKTGDKVPWTEERTYGLKVRMFAGQGYTEVMRYSKDLSDNLGQ